jgi:iron(III) transport system permease protein
MSSFSLSWPGRVARVFLLLLGAWLVLPLVALAASWLNWDPAAREVLWRMGQTVLPDYVMTSLWLCLCVAVAVAVVGTACAVAVTLFDFPGRRVAEWALLLPLAMPAYVVAYAYTDFLQFSGPMQVWMRESFGWRGRVLPEVRSLGGAVWVFTFSLYPYVYLLVRTALGERAGRLMEAARLLGAPLSRRVREVALPLARPAIAAGVALALMETLADYGVSSYFGIQSFTAGIYKAWLVMDDRVAAAQLSTVLLVVVGALLWLEKRAQRRQRFAVTRGGGATAEVRSLPLSGGARLLVWGVCAAPVLAGFVFPVAFMLRPLLEGWSELPWGAFLAWTANSLKLAGLSALLATALAVGLAYAQRRRDDRLIGAVVQCVGLGYAVPGAVVVVGLLLPVAWLQQVWPAIQASHWVTATSLGLLWAYLVRFSAVALQSVQSGYSRIPRSLDDTARMLGAGAAGVLCRVHLPLLGRSAAVAALLVFVDVMKELPATLVLRPFDSDTLAVVTYQLARDERLGEAALPALALVFAGLLPVIVLSRTLRSRQGQ